MALGLEARNAREQLDSAGRTAGPETEARAAALGWPGLFMTKLPVPTDDRRMIC
jgi:hypothetical protein